jgi:hypothetical protein
MLDNQSRSDAGGFQENALAGKLIHGLLGYEKLIPESMAMYQHGRPQFRLSSKPAPEARMWMLAGFAGGIQPWWHHVGAYHEDRRMFRTAEPVMRWHAANQDYLVNRQPLATVAVGWSQRNFDFFGRDNADERVEQPYRGFTQALVRARIPFVPLHLDNLDRDAANIAVLVLPNVGVLTDAQIESIRRFVQRGGWLVATGQTGFFDQWGEERGDSALANLFGVANGKAAAHSPQMLHSYLRLSPDISGRVYGPSAGVEPADDERAGSGKRHAILAGFEETNLLPFGGTLAPLSIKPDAQVLLTFIPPFPAMPPEISYMRQPRTDIPGLVVNGHVVYLPADVDRRFALANMPDHGDLLANIVRWAAGDTLPLDVRGPGLLNCEIYQQDRRRLILHIVNLTSAATWRAPVHELIPVGPLQIGVRWNKPAPPKVVRSLVAADETKSSVDAGWLRFNVPSVTDHEVIVVEV